MKYIYIYFLPFNCCMLLCLYHIEIFLFVLFLILYVMQVNNLTLALSVKFRKVSFGNPFVLSCFVSVF